MRTRIRSGGDRWKEKSPVGVGPVYAYLDPGSGSMMVQLLLGGVAGIVVLVKIYWRRFLDRIRFRSEHRRPPQ